ncbi:RhaT Permease drug-metabolite transporter superfamily [Pyrenophora teres f. maculata]|nr:RhaT Permease drug-metabolite transporter superfamily [Pyrenophora teres f. maculata]
MPESIPLRKKPQPHPRTLAHTLSDDFSLENRNRSSSPVLVSGSSSRQASRTRSSSRQHRKPNGKPSALKEPDSPLNSDVDFDDWDEHDAAMPSDLRPSIDYHRDGRANAPLLGRKTEDDTVDEGMVRSTHTFHERDPETQAKLDTRKRYTYAALLLALSLVSFTVQTETAVYIQHQLKWEKPYCMLYMTHGSWVVLWPVTLFLLRLQHWNEPWATFWRRHVQLLRQTALMVQHQNLHPTPRQSQASPVRYMVKMTCFITCALTLAGGSWYVAVNQTTASDLTAIYNCSAFFAYAFSIPILREKVRTSKIVAVAIAIAGVFVVAYGDTSPAKHGSKSGGGAGGDKAPPSREAENRAFGNLVIGVGSVLYGLYEVLYKRFACPPEGAAPNKGVIFANLFGSLIGGFTLCVLWIPIPFLHWMGWEIFELPKGEQAWMMAISVLANATFSGAFLALISLTSPVLSSVAALLTIFIVAIVDQLLPPPLNSPLTPAAIVGGLLIIGAFSLLSWASYKEMDEERRHKLEEALSESDD